MLLRRNVLVFHSGALGDFVLSWPLAAALGRLHPQSRVIYVTAASKGALAEKVLRIDSTDAEAGWHCLHGDEPEALPDRSRKLLKEAHSVYAFTGGDDARWVENVGLIAPAANVLTLLAKPPDAFRHHASQFLLDELSRAPAIRSAVEQILSSIASRGIGTVRSAGASTGPVVIHPGSGSPAKCWPVGRYVELIELLKARGKTTQIVLGEVERERFGADKLKALQTVSPVVYTDTYLALLGEFAKASAFIGNDSGPGHLAGIIGVPTVSIFGPTDPAIWKPLGPRTGVVRNENLEALTSDKVLAEFDRVVSQ